MNSHNNNNAQSQISIQLNLAREAKKNQLSQDFKKKLAYSIGANYEEVITDVEKIEKNFDLMSANSQVTFQKSNKYLTDDEKKLIGKCYFNKGLGIFELFCKQFDKTTSIQEIKSKVDSIELDLKEENAHNNNSNHNNNNNSNKPQGLLAQVKKNYNISQSWYDAAGDKEFVDKIRINKLYLNDDFLIEVLRRLSQLINNNSNDNSQNYYRTTLENILTNVYRPAVAPVIARDNRYADTTWLMLAADSNITLPSVAPFILTNPTATLAVIRHPHRKKLDPNNYGFSVSTLAARRNNVEFFSDVVESLKILNPQILNEFINSINSAGAYRGSSTLMFSCCQGSQPLIKILLENRVNIRLKIPKDRADYPGFSALSFLLQGIVTPNKFAAKAQSEDYLFATISLIDYAKANLKDNTYDQYISDSLQALDGKVDVNSLRTELNIFRCNNIISREDSKGQQIIGELINKINPSNTPQSSAHKRNIEELDTNNNSNTSDSRKKQNVTSESSAANNNISTNTIVSSMTADVFLRAISAAISAAITNKKPLSNEEIKKITERYIKPGQKHANPDVVETFKNLETFIGYGDIDKVTILTIENLLKTADYLIKQPKPALNQATQQQALPPLISMFTPKESRPNATCNHNTLQLNKLSK